MTLQTELMNSHVEALARYVEKVLGLHFPESRRADLVRGAEQAARELGFDGLASFADWLGSSEPTRKQLEVLSDHLTIGETYFFREESAFDFLQFELLPQFSRELQAGRPSLRFWSAACCSGEEAYSIAMLLDRRLPEIGDVEVSILATDVNPSFLAKAQEGVYSKWSFRALPDSYRETYFTQIAENRFEIAPHIRRRVEFRTFNLAGDDYAALRREQGAMDIIFCRNVMIYFQPELCRRVVSGLHSALAEGGWLVVSPCEIPLVPSALFEASNAGTPSVLRRADAGSGERSSSYTPNPEVAPAVAERPPRRSDSDVSAPAVRHFGTAEGAGRGADARSVAEAFFERGPLDRAPVALDESCAGGLDETRSVRGEARELTARIRSCANRGRFSEALERCAAAIASGNVDPDLHYLHATILLEAGREGEAEAALRRVLYLDLDHALAHFSLGTLCRRQGKSEEAAKHYRNALESLSSRAPDEIIAASDGLTAGALGGVIEEMLA